MILINWILDSFENYFKVVNGYVVLDDDQLKQKLPFSPQDKYQIGFFKTLIQKDVE